MNIFNQFRSREREPTPQPLSRADIRPLTEEVDAGMISEALSAA
jgi:hypothetical protein